jgi:hypothetical protein
MAPCGTDPRTRGDRLGELLIEIPDDDLGGLAAEEQSGQRPR